MKDLLEIRWHGRGGQGAKTVALLFAEAVLSSGKYIQAFPEYGPERMGAPVQAFNRLSTAPITLHCGVTEPEYVVVLDPTLIGQVDVTAGLGENGKIIVNTPHKPEQMRKELKLKHGKVYTIDASRIAKENIGLDKPNTPMMGALVKISKFLEIENVLDDTKSKLEVKFVHKPEVILGNLACIKKAYEEVQEEQ